GQTLEVIRTLAPEFPRIEVAACRIFQNPVSHAGACIACLEHSLMEHRIFVWRNIGFFALMSSLRYPYRLDCPPCPVETGVACNDAVEIGGEGRGVHAHWATPGDGT